jgi:hypothetical protein
MARCRLGAGEGEGDATVGGVGGVCYKGGSSGSRGSQNSSSETTANVTKHRKSLNFD